NEYIKESRKSIRSQLFFAGNTKWMKLPPHSEFTCYLQNDILVVNHKKSPFASSDPRYGGIKKSPVRKFPTRLFGVIKSWVRFC
ncbi:MAG: hypothetical protein WA140_03435, partial [Geobacteraceae bacterium]